MHKQRLARLRARIKKQGLDGMVVSLPAHRRYYSGFAPDDGQWGESSGWLYVTMDQAVLVTDFRYEITAREQAGLFEVRLHQGLAREVAALVKAGRVKRLGLESMAMLVAHRDALAGGLPEVELVPTQGLASGPRTIKDAAEVRALRASLGLMEEVLDTVLAGDLVGRTERDVAREIVRRTEDAGAEGPAFPPIVASGPNAAEPHAEPGDKVINQGETVIFDVGAKLNGYCSDISRTVVAGGLAAAEEPFREIYGLVRQAQLAAIAGIMPFMTGAEADGLAREVIDQGGYGARFGHSLGHGVGLATHEAPSVSPRTDEVLEPGMIFTVEPGIYLPGWGGVRLEEMVLLTGEGCELLNRLDRFYEI